MNKNAKKKTQDLDAVLLQACWLSWLEFACLLDGLDEEDVKAWVEHFAELGADETGVGETRNREAAKAFVIAVGQVRLHAMADNANEKVSELLATMAAQASA